jgi:hypothetical protein
VGQLLEYQPFNVRHEAVKMTTCDWLRLTPLYPQPSFSSCEAECTAKHPCFMTGIDHVHDKRRVPSKINLVWATFSCFHRVLKAKVGCEASFDCSCSYKELPLHRRVVPNISASQLMTHQTRTHPSRRLSVPSVMKHQQSSSSLKARTPAREENGATPSHQSQLSLIKLAQTPSQRRPFRDELLSKDFSKLNPNYDQEKYWEYCKALQTQAKDLTVENKRLREDGTEQPKKQVHVPTAQKGTDKTLDSQKPPFDIDADELAVVFNPSDNRLGTVKGSELREYIPDVLIFNRPLIYSRCQLHSN